MRWTWEGMILIRSPLACWPRYDANNKIHNSNGETLAATGKQSSRDNKSIATFALAKACRVPSHLQLSQSCCSPCQQRPAANADVPPSPRPRGGVTALHSSMGNNIHQPIPPLTPSNPESNPLRSHVIFAHHTTLANLSRHRHRQQPAPKQSLTEPPPPAP